MNEQQENLKYSKISHWENISKILKYSPPAIFIFANVLIFSSALKATNYDYSLTGEIVKNINIQTWWVINIPIATFLAFFILSPILLYPMLVRVNRIISNDTDGKIDQIRRFTPYWLKRLIPGCIKKITPNKFKILILTAIQAACLLAISAYIERSFGFIGFFALGALSTVLTSAIFSFSLIFLFLCNSFLEISDKTLYRIAIFQSVVLLAFSPMVSENSFHTGQSCLIQTIDNNSKAVGTIIPLDFSKDSLKAIWIEEGKTGYVRNISIDTSYSIYPDSCKRLENEKSEPDPFRPTFNLNK